MNNCNKSSCFIGISKLNKCEILALINAVSLALTQGLEEEDTEILGGILTSIGDTISLIAAVEGNHDKKSDDS
jgi:hypothetical protein